MRRRHGQSGKWQLSRFWQYDVYSENALIMEKMQCYAGMRWKMLNVMKGERRRTERKKNEEQKNKNK